MNRPITPVTYAAEIVAMSWRHGGELAVALGGAIAICLAALASREAFGSIGHLLLVLIPPVAAVFLFQATVAGWRLHRRMTTALATTRSLLDSNAGDRADLERHLFDRYRRREERIHQRNNARVERLDGEIAALQAEAHARR